MKKLLFGLLLFPCLVVLGYAQTPSTLAFSQVKLVTSLETVPSNTVWKINNILPNSSLTTIASGTSVSSTSSTNTSISVNGNSIVLTSSSARYNSYNNSSYVTALTSVFGSIISGPIWIPAGTTLAAGNNVYAISVTEFIIVP